MNRTKTTEAVRSAIHRVLPHPHLPPAKVHYPQRYTFLDDDCTAREARHL